MGQVGKWPKHFDLTKVLKSIQMLLARISNRKKILICKAFPMEEY